MMAKSSSQVGAVSKDAQEAAQEAQEEEKSGEAMDAPANENGVITEEAEGSGEPGGEE